LNREYRRGSRVSCRVEVIWSLTSLSKYFMMTEVIATGLSYLSFLGNRNNVGPLEACVKSRLG
jgi:hypothetical protein